MIGRHSGWIGGKTPRKQGTYRESVGSYLDLLGKTAPLLLIVGALLIWVYLRKNNLSEVFLMAVGTSQGLIAFSGGALIFVLLATHALILPPLFTAVVKKAARDSFRIYEIPIPWMAPGAVFASIFFLLLVPVVSPFWLLCQVLLFIGMLCAAFVYAWKVSVAQLVVLCVATLFGFSGLLMSFWVIADGVTYYGQSAIEGWVVWIFYIFISGWFVAAVLKGRSIKNSYLMLAFLGFAIVIILMMRGADYVADKVAGILELRHEKPRWYWVSKDAAQKLIPDGIGVVERNQEKYIFAKSRFSLGDVRVLCLPFPPEKEASKEVNKEVCSFFDKTEVRRVDSLYFENAK